MDEIQKRYGRNVLAVVVIMCASFALTGCNKVAQSASKAFTKGGTGAVTNIAAKAPVTNIPRPAPVFTPKPHVPEFHHPNPGFGPKKAGSQFPNSIPPSANKPPHSNHNDWMKELGGKAGEGVIQIGVGQFQNDEKKKR